MKEAIEIGLVGVGPWGGHILRDLRSLGAVVHAAARFPESIARAQTGGAASIVDAPEKLPETCAGYVVANRTVSHLDAVEALLPRARPIFVEKPIGIDLPRIRRLPKAAHDLVFIMHKWRYHPGVIELARIAASGEFGPPLGLRTFRTGWGNPHADVSSLWILAPHELSIALAILGEVPQPVAATRDPMTDGSEGTLVKLETHARLPMTMEVSSGHPVPLRRIMLRCRDAICQLDSSSYNLVSVRYFDNDKPHVIPVADTMPLLAELDAFLGNLRGGPPPLSPLSDEIAIVEAIASIETLIARA